MATIFWEWLQYILHFYHPFTDLKWSTPYLCWGFEEYSAIQLSAPGFQVFGVPNLFLKKTGHTLNYWYSIFQTHVATRVGVTWPKFVRMCSQWAGNTLPLARTIFLKSIHLAGKIFLIIIPLAGRVFLKSVGHEPNKWGPYLSHGRVWIGTSKWNLSLGDWYRNKSYPLWGWIWFKKLPLYCDNLVLKAVTLIGDR